MLVCLCPASPEFLSDASRAAFAARSEEALRSALRDLSPVHLVTAGEIQQLYPVPTYYDPHADELGHVPYTPEFFAALGTVIARKLHAHRTSRYKVIALDCDETLWRGVCGEDGARNSGHPHAHHCEQARRRQRGEIGSDDQRRFGLADDEACRRHSR